MVPGTNESDWGPVPCLQGAGGGLRKTVNKDTVNKLKDGDREAAFTWDTRCGGWTKENCSLELTDRR